MIFFHLGFPNPVRFAVIKRGHAHKMLHEYSRKCLIRSPGGPFWGRPTTGDPRGPESMSAVAQTSGLLRAAHMVKDDAFSLSAVSLFCLETKLSECSLEQEKPRDFRRRRTHHRSFTIFRK